MQESTLKRKVREAYIAIQLEQMYSKDEILQMYLNTINYGQGAYGIQAAAELYFSKNAKDLTIAEARLLEFLRHLLTTTQSITLTIVSSVVI